MFNFFYRHLPLKKSLICFLITAILFISGGSVLFLPKKAQAQMVTTDPGSLLYQGLRDIWVKGKEFATAAATHVSAAAATWEKSDSLLAQVTYMAAQIALREILAIITNDIIDWVKGDYKGKPAFLSHSFDEFAADVGNNAGGDFVTQYLGAGWLCEPFDTKIKIALTQEKRFNETAKCTLENMGKNLKNFYADFKQGGWKEWLNLSQPQNNFYGALILSKDAKDQAEQEAKDSIEKELSFGQGFLSIKDCVWYDAKNDEVETQKNVRGNPPLPDACIPHPDDPQHATIGGFMPPCESVCTVKTPSSVVSEMTNKVSTGEMERLNMTLATIAGKAGGTFKPYIMAIADTMIDQLIKKGLFELKGGGPSTKQPNQPLSPGQKMPETSNLPFYIEQELLDVQALLETLKMLEKKNKDINLVQQKTINLFKENDQQLASQPIDFLTHLNFLLPVFSGIKAWNDICYPQENLSNPNDRHRVTNFTNLIHDSFEEFGQKKIFVSQSENSTSKTIIYKSGNIYSFKDVSPISEGTLILINTKETVIEQNGEETVTTEIIPLERYYEMIDWNVGIEGLDQLESSTDEEAVNHVKQVINDFIASVKTKKAQTEKLTLLIAPTKLLVEKYLSAINSYLLFFEQNLTSLDFDKVNTFKKAYETDPSSLNIANPESNINADGNPDLNAIFAAKEIALFNDRGAAIIAVQKIGQPQPFESTEFKDLNQEMQEFASATTEDNGDLTQLLGDRSLSDKKHLYGFAKELSNDPSHVETLYRLCFTRDNATP